MTGSETVAEGMKPVLEYYYYDGMSRLIFAANADTAVAYAFDPLSAVPAVRETVSVRQTVSLTSADLESGTFFEDSLATFTSFRVVTREFSFGGRPSRATYPSGRVIEYDYQSAGLLDSIREGAHTIADYDYVGGRVLRRTLGGAVRMDVGYDAASHGEHITAIAHSKVGGGPALEDWSFDWDGNYNKVAREDVKRGVLHEYVYDGRNRMTRSKRDGSDSVIYTLDASGNRLSTAEPPDPAENYVVAGLHEYSTSPLGTMDYDNNGNLVELPDQFERYQYNVVNELLDRWGFGSVLHHDYAGTITADYSILSGDFTAAEGYLDVADGQGGRIINDTVPADLDHVTFSYLSRHDPNDPDGDPETADYGPDYYALFLMKVGQENQAPPDDEWNYLALVIEPNNLVLNRWEDDAVTTIGTFAITSARDTWYDVQVVFSGTNNEHVAIRHGVHGGALAEFIDVSTGLANEDTNVSFGVGQDGDYHFDNLRIHADSISAESMEQEFVYDVFGRRVARTTYENYIARTTYYAYDGDKVIEELDGDGNVEASYVYGQYLDEVLEMWRDTNGDETYEQYYYLHDDLFNVLALADHNGDIVERYEYGDYGAPTVFDGNDIETGNESAYGNPYLFNGRHWDADTGLYWYRTRYMDPELGRFISRDTIGLWGDENNLGNPYSYVGNNPWSRLDPFGEQELNLNPEYWFRQAFASLGEFLAGGSTDLATNDWHFGSGVSGFFGGVLRTLSIRAIPHDSSASPVARMGAESGATMIPLLSSAENMVTGETVTGYEADRWVEGAILSVEMIGYGLASRQSVVALRATTVSESCLAGSVERVFAVGERMPSGRIAGFGPGTPAIGQGGDGFSNPYFVRFDPMTPGRPDPKYSIDTFAFSSGDVTSKGGIRNAGEFWRQWQTLQPDSLSSSNWYLIDNWDTLKVSPKVDDKWIEVFPEHAPYRDDVIVHHHVDFGRYAIPVPKETHVGSGGAWHTK